MVSTKYSTQRALGAKESDGQDRQQAMKQALTQVEKQFGKGAIMRLGESNVVDVDVIPTGCLSLDAALGIGGVPRGRVVEMYGPESAGKTMCALNMVAQAQKQGGITAFVDAEHALDVGFAKKLGVDVENLLVAQPDCGEEALEITDTLVRSGALDLIVVDSVAALVPRAELEGEMGDAQMGLQARLMSQALRKLTGSIQKSRTTVIFINQLRMKIGVMFGNPETTTGGRALCFYASVRMDIRGTGNIKDGDEVIGRRTRVKVVKNKVAPPFREAEFDILFRGDDVGISKEGDLLDLGVEYQIVEKSGTWFSYGDLRLGQGRENARIFLKENEQTTAQIEDQVRVAMKIPPRGKAEDKVGDETITGTTNKVSVDNNKKIKSSEQELSSVT
ncbi:MAG: recombinase RecA [SAR202 cluster bacterium]|mgnify:CR=1 FL=1|nr:recombinase RecA [SAR202 cluster bacterium]|tara:strand:- start:1263 stop:2432 length:1170 start_codon:yes stop_codon:yes gene_type:complete